MARRERFQRWKDALERNRNMTVYILLVLGGLCLLTGWGLLPQMVSTFVPVRAARCWLAESIDTIRSIADMAAISSGKVNSPAIDSQPRISPAH